MSIFKAYDVRGIYPEQINEEVIYKIGRAFVQFFGFDAVIVGRDMRLSSPQLSTALINGILDQGANVINIGIVGTEVLNFSSGFLNKAGIMITASHNPSEYNGIKPCAPGAVSIGENNGLMDIKRLVENNSFDDSEKGSLKEFDVWPDYKNKILSFTNQENLKPLRIVVDAGNGMGGKLVSKVFSELPFEIVPLYFEEDGSFPNHQPSPIESKNLIDLKKKVIEENASLGIAFDGDADRVFFIDENGDDIDSSFIISLIAKHTLSEKPQSKILYNLVCSKIIPETIKEFGGEAVIERVGHSFIKPKMSKENIVFGGEHSGHYFYKDYWFNESSLITSLIILEMICQENKTISEIIIPLQKYFKIEETNFEVPDKNIMIQKLEQNYSMGAISKLDGLTIEFDNWWFNVRPSNTEPVLRLNLEANSEDLQKEKLKEIKNLIKTSS